MTDEIDKTWTIDLKTSLGYMQAFVDSGANIDVINQEYAIKEYGHYVKDIRSFSASTASSQIVINKNINIDIQLSAKALPININLYLVPNLPYNIIIGRYTAKRLGYTLELKTDEPHEVRLERAIDPHALPPEFEPQIERTTFNASNTTVTNNTQINQEVFLVQAERDSIFDIFCIRGFENDTIHELYPISAVENTNTVYPTPNIAENTKPEIKTKFMQLYENYKTHIAALHQYDLGKIENFEFKLELKDPTKRPPNQPYYRCSPEHAQEIQRQIDLMLKYDIAETSTSDCASPMFGVPKKNGELRCCVDYRVLNQLTLGYHHPLPRIEDLLNKVATGKYFASLDIRQAFLNVMVEKETRKLMAFKTPGAHVQPKRMLFGVKGAPAFQQMIMSRLFSHLKKVQIYLDDIIIYADTEEELCEKLETVFEILKENNIKLNFDKCLFFQKEIEYLGRIVAYNKIRIQPQYIKKLLNLEIPKTKKELQMVLGVIGWVAPWIPHLAHLSSPLHDLKQKHAKWKWTPRHTESFLKIKNLIKTADYLTPPDPRKQFVIWCDASQIARGACLAQQDLKSPGYELCEFWSKKFTKAELNWHTYSKELSAILGALLHWRIYLNSSPHPTIIYTDHHNIVHLYNITKLPNLSQRLQRWACIFQEFDLIIRHIKGEKNILADYLSRALKPLEQPEITTPDEAKEQEIKQEKHKIKLEKKSIKSINKTNKKPTQSSEKKILHKQEQQKLETEINVMEWKNITTANKKQTNTFYYKELQMGPSLNTEILPMITRKKARQQKLQLEKELGERHIAEQNKKTREYLKTHDPVDSLEDTDDEEWESPKRRKQVKKKEKPTLRKKKGYKPLKIQEESENEDTMDVDEEEKFVVTPQIKKFTLYKDEQNAKTEKQLREINNSSWNEYLDDIFSMLERDRSGIIAFQDEDVLKNHQLNDSLIQNAIKFKYFRPESIEYEEAKAELTPSLQSNIEKRVLRSNEITFYNGKKWAPFSLQYSIMQFYHSYLGPHSGVSRTFDLITREYWWPGIDKDVRQFVKTCHTCQMTQGKIDPNIGEYQQFIATHVNHIVHIDLVGPLPEAAEGYKYILTMIDRFSKWAMYAPTRTATAKEVAFIFFQRWICSMGTPKRLITDRGSNFVGHLFKHFNQLFGITPTFTSAYNPRANGQIERIHGPLKKGLRDICLDKSINIFKGIDWDIFLPAIQASYNNHTHPATGYTPYEIIHGRPFEFLPPHHITDLEYNKLSDNIKQYMEQIKTQIKIVQAQVKENQKKYDKKRFATTNKNRYPNPFEIGDLVRIDRSHLLEGNDKSLGVKFTGPYTVSRILPNNTIEVVDPSNNGKFKTNIKWVTKYYRQINKNQINTIQINTEINETQFQQTLKALTTAKYRTMQKDTITRTPTQLAELISYVSDIYSEDQKTITKIDLFAGDGAITKTLEPPCIAVEKDKKLIDIGQKIAPQAKWLQYDLTKWYDIQQLLLQHKHKFSQVISNPPWELGYWTILLAYQLLKYDKPAYLIILLPSDFFIATERKRQIFHQLKINIIKQYLVGRWNYLKDIPKSSPRIGTDSIFIISNQTTANKTVQFDTEWLLPSESERTKHT